MNSFKSFVKSPLHAKILIGLLIGIPVGLILGVDRILDMCRTIVNITGDASAAVIVAATGGTLRKPGKNI